MLHKLNLSFVPKHNPVKENDVKLLCNFIIEHHRILALTGAGVSTESGIPDYRSERVGLFARSSSKPITYQAFIQNEVTRQRYWARNYVGWPRFSSREPNYNHKFLKEMEPAKIACVITQNVDNLHFKANSRNVIELHGSAYRVICLKCPYKIDRQLFQALLTDFNVDFNNVKVLNSVRPDGDVDLPQEIVENFNVPPCPNCGSILKPEIVFFGDNIPKHVTNSVDKEILNCDSVLVLGTTLATYSSYRIILEAAKLNKPITIINIGQSKGDSHAKIKINAKCSDVLSKVRTSNDFNYNTLSNNYPDPSFL